MYLAKNLFGAALAIGVGLFGDPLAALVGVRKRVPWLLVEIGVAPGGAGFGLVVNLSVRDSLAQPYASSFLTLHRFSLSFSLQHCLSLKCIKVL